MKVYLVFYEDFSGVDKIFYDKDTAELFRLWTNVKPEVQEHEIDNSLIEKGFRKIEE